MNAAWTKILITAAYISLTVGSSVVIGTAVINGWNLPLASRLGFLVLMVPVPLALVALAQWKGRPHVPDVDVDAALGVASFVFTAVTFIAVPWINKKTPDVDWATVLFAVVGLLFAGIGFYRGFLNPSAALVIARSKYRAWRDRGSRTEKLAGEIIDLHAKLGTCAPGQLPSVNSKLQAAIADYEAHVASPKP